MDEWDTLGWLALAVVVITTAAFVWTLYLAFLIF
jgi:hypothetical protein